MPYQIKKYKYGFRVCKKRDDGEIECYSKKPLTKKRARKQLSAIALSSLRRKGKL